MPKDSEKTIKIGDVVVKSEYTKLENTFLEMVHILRKPGVITTKFKEESILPIEKALYEKQWLTNFQHIDPTKVNIYLVRDQKNKVFFGLVSNRYGDKIAPYVLGGVSNGDLYYAGFVMDEYGNLSTVMCPGNGVEGCVTRYEQDTIDAQLLEVLLDVHAISNSFEN